MEHQNISIRLESLPHLTGLELGLLQKVSHCTSGWKTGCIPRSYHHSAKAFEMKEEYLTLLKKFFWKRIQRCARLILNRVRTKEDKYHYNYLIEHPEEATTNDLEKSYSLQGESPFRKGLIRTLQDMIGIGALEKYFFADTNKYIFTIPVEHLQVRN